MLRPRLGLSGLAQTDPAHIAGRPLSGGAGGGADPYAPQASPDSETRLDGNQVVLEEQMSKMTEARMDYEAAIDFYQQSMNLISIAARAPRQEQLKRGASPWPTRQPRTSPPPSRSQPPRSAPSRRACASSRKTSPTPTAAPRRRAPTPISARVPVFEPQMTDQGGRGVHLARVQPDTSTFHTEYQPGAPGADAKGYVKMPNVDPLTEAMDMKEAQRAYDANLNMIETARAMQMRTLDIIKK